MRGFKKSEIQVKGAEKFFERENKRQERARRRGRRAGEQAGEGAWPWWSSFSLSSLPSASS